MFPVKVPVSSACTKATDDGGGEPPVVVVVVVLVVVLGGGFAAQVATSGVDYVPCKVPPEQFTVTD